MLFHLCQLLLHLIRAFPPIGGHPRSKTPFRWCNSWASQVLILAKDHSGGAKQKNILKGGWTGFTLIAQGNVCLPAIQRPEPCEKFATALM